MPPLRFELRTFALCEDTSATRYPYAIEANETDVFVFNYINTFSLVRPRLMWSPRRILYISRNPLLPLDHNDEFVSTN